MARSGSHSVITINAILKSLLKRNNQYKINKRIPMRIFGKKKKKKFYNKTNQEVKTHH